MRKGKRLPPLASEFERVFLHAGHGQRGWGLVARSPTWCWGGCSTWSSTRGSTAVMSHMSLYEMTGRKSRAKTQLSGKDTCSDDAGKLSGVITWVRGMWASDTK